jgi:hypothetical protein
VIRDNGNIGMDVQWATRQVTVTHCTFESTGPDAQPTAIRIDADARDIALEDNTFVNCPVEVADHRGE